MSSTLMWKPVKNAQGSLSYELKRTISRKLWDTDGSCGGSAVINKDFIPYLEGIRDAGIKGADELIKILETHGKVEIWHEF